MTIRKRIEEAITLAQSGFSEAALIIALVAVAAGSRRKYSKQEIRKGGDAFTKYLSERIKRTLSYGSSQGRFMTISFKGKQIDIAEALYREFRCNLIHEAELPAGVRLEGGDPGLSISVGQDSFILGLGWLDLMIDVVINDPNLRPVFDDMRRKAPDDIVYTGSEPEEEFCKRFRDEFFLSEGRLDVIKRFVAAIGVEQLGRMSDDELRSLWDDKVVPHSGSFGLSGSCLTGLSSIGPAYAGQHREFRGDLAFHKHDGNYSLDRPWVYNITDKGMQMIRVLVQHCK